MGMKILTLLNLITRNFHIYQTIIRRGGYSTMFSEPDVNNCFGIIAQVLSNAVRNSVNKESIAHILIQLCR